MTCSRAAAILYSPVYSRIFPCSYICHFYVCYSGSSCATLLFPTLTSFIYEINLYKTVFECSSNESTSNTSFTWQLRFRELFAFLPNFSRWGSEILPIFELRMSCQEEFIWYFSNSIFFFHVSVNWVHYVNCSLWITLSSHTSLIQVNWNLKDKRSTTILCHFRYFC